MNQFKKIDISQSCLELARLMIENPKAIEMNIIKEAELYLGFFQDPNYSDHFQNIKDLKKEILLLVAEDVSRGIKVLQSASLGITFHINKLKTYVCPHGTNPEGSIVYSVNWKNIRSFLNWRKGEEINIPQDIINKCLYLISYKLSELKA